MRGQGWTAFPGRRASFAKRVLVGERTSLLHGGVLAAINSHRPLCNQVHPPKLDVTDPGKLGKIKKQATKTRLLPKLHTYPIASAASCKTFNTTF